MKSENRADALLYLEVTALTNVSNQRLGNTTLSLFLRSRATNTRRPIASHSLLMSKEKMEIQQLGMTVCARQDFIEVQLQEQESKVNAYLKFPLDKLVEMPRVKHEIECMLVEKNWDRFFEGPLRNIVQVDLGIISFDKIIGKFVVTCIEIDLTRNTELIGEMDPFVELQLQGESRKTAVRDNEGKHSIWKEHIEFQIKDIRKGLTLLATVFDKDNLSSDTVGSRQIDLVEELMLIPQQEPKQKSFTLLFNKQSAGIIKIDYQFTATPFNF